MEIARADASLATLTLIQSVLVMETIQSYASEEQKKKFFPEIIDFQIISSWALIEPLVGSDAANITTSVKKASDGYVLNGGKRWIGSANRDVTIVWARNEESKKIEGFFVPKGTPGVEVEVIQNKLAMRTIQNCNISYKDALIPLENKLPGADLGFASINKLLENSRIFVAWITVGLALGVYD